MIIGGSSLPSAGYGIRTLPAKPALTPEQKNGVQNAALEAQDARQAQQVEQQTAKRSAAVGVAEVNNQKQVVESYVNASKESSESSVETNNRSGYTLELYQQQQKAQQLQTAQQLVSSPLQKRLDEMTGNSMSQGLYVSTTV